MIIARYITKEILYGFLSITCILLLIALSNRFAVYLAKAATGELPIGLVFHLVWLYTPELLSFVIPLSFFISILFAFGRMHTDSEMTVLFACGLTWGYISRITLFSAMIIMLIVGFLSLWVVPNMAVQREKALSEGEALAIVHSMLPGRFQVLADGNLVFYAENVQSNTNTLQEVFIAEKLQPGKENAQGLALITASTARVDIDPKTHDAFLVLNNGYRYQGNPGQHDYKILKFEEYGRKLEKEMATSSSASMGGLRLKNSEALLDSSKASDLAELEWRLSLPVSVPILALLAIPLARVTPRHGRFAKFLPAIVLYIIYYNLFTVAKRWVAAGNIPAFIGVWWVHLLFLCLGLGLLAYESGWFHERFGGKA